MNVLPCPCGSPAELAKSAYYSHVVYVRCTHKDCWLHSEINHFSFNPIRFEKSDNAIQAWNALAAKLRAKIVAAQIGVINQPAQVVNNPNQGQQPDYPVQLLPCPFCGRVVEVMADDNGGSRNHPHPVYWIECRTFICDGLKTGKFSSQSDLAEYWNNRVGGAR